MTNTIAGGGGERQAALWAAACAADHHVELLSFARVDGEYALPDAVHVEYGGKRSRRDAARLVGRIRALARRVDVIVAFQVYPAVLCLLAGVRVPWVMVVGDDPRFHWDDGDHLRRIPNALIRLTFRRAAAVCAPSRGLVRCYAELGVKARSFTCVPNIVDPAAFVDGLPQRSGAVFVGRLYPEKDPLLAADAARLAGCPLTFVGAAGPLRGELERLAADAPLTLAPFTPNPWDAYRRHRVLVVTSRGETFGNVIVESLAAGTPVVSVDCDFGPREILAGASFSAVVERRPDAVAAALREVMSRPYTDAEARECRAIAERYSAAAIEPLIADVLGRALTPGGARSRAARSW